MSTKSKTYPFKGYQLVNGGVPVGPVVFDKKQLTPCKAMGESIATVMVYRGAS